MSGECTRDIEKEFSVELYRFYEFLDHFALHSPIERTNIHALLVRYVGNVQQITDYFMTHGSIVGHYECAPGPIDQFSFPVLSRQDPTQDDHWMSSSSQEHFNGIGSDSYLGLHDESIQVVPNNGYGHSAHSHDGPPLDIQPAHATDTLHPMVLSFDSANNHSSVVQRALHPRAALEALPLLEPSTTSASHVTEVRQNVKSQKRVKSSRARADGKRQKRTGVPMGYSTGNLALQHTFTPSLSTEDSEKAGMFHRLFISTASPGAMLQLKNTLSAVRRPGEVVWSSHENSTVEDTVKTLDKLERLEQCTALMRRVCLLHLIHRRDQLLEKFKNERAEERTKITSVQATPVGGKVESTVLDRLIEEGYPYTAPRPGQSEDPRPWRERFPKERKTILNLLGQAKNWQQGGMQFGLGFLALLPKEESYPHVPPFSFSFSFSPRYEKLPEKACEGLLRALKTKGNGYVCQAALQLTPFVKAVYDGKNYLSRLRIELLKSQDLEMMDQSRIVELCEELPINDGDGNYSTMLQ